MSLKFKNFFISKGIAKIALKLIDLSRIKSNKLKQTYNDFYYVLEKLKANLIDHSSEQAAFMLAAHISHAVWECLQFVAIMLGGLCCLSEHPFQRLLQEFLIWLSPRNNLVLAESWCKYINQITNKETL